MQHTVVLFDHARLAQNREMWKAKLEAIMAEVVQLSLLCRGPMSRTSPDRGSAKD